MMNLIIFELKKFLKKKKNIVTIVMFCILMVIFAMLNNSLATIKNRSIIKGYESELKSAKESLNTLNENKNDGKQSKKQVILIQNTKKQIKLLNDRLQARINNNWKEELKIQIQLDNKLRKGIENHSILSGEKISEINDRISLNKMLYSKNIKPIIEENDISAYNYIRLAEEGIFPIFAMVFVVLLSADFVSNENDEGTFKFLLTQPISRSKVLISKIIAASLICFISIVLIITIFFIVLGIIKGWGSPFYPVKYYNANIGVKYIPIREYIPLLLPLNFLFIIFVVSIGILISTITQNSTSAISIAIIIVVSMYIFNTKLKILKGISHLNPFIYNNATYVLNGNLISQFNDRHITYSTGVVVLVIYSLICYIASGIIFKRKDIKC